MSQMVQNFALAALKLHPRNEEFFSNVEGEDFKRLKESIGEQGILMPLRVSSDMVIVSGHQRYRAARELGMTQVPVIVDESLLDEDEKLAQLIASNFGRMKNDPVKQGRWIKEYERLRGVRHGGDRKSNGNNFRLITQDDIAKELGVDARTLRNLKQLNALLPELQDIISEGRINATTGYKLIAKLSEEEQQHLLEVLPAAESFTQKQVQKYVDQIQGYEAQVAKLTAEKEKMTETAVDAMNAANSSSDSKAYLAMQSEMKKAQEDYRRVYEEHNALKKSTAKTAEEMNQLRRQLQVAQDRANKTPDVIEREVEVKVYPDDYDEIKAKAQQWDEHVKNNIYTGEIHALNSPEDQQREFDLYFMQEIEGFLSQLRGRHVEINRLNHMPLADRSLCREALEEIMDIAAEMLKELKKSEVA